MNFSQVLPFGFRNAPAIFNRTIRKILTKHKCSNFACHHFDDIVVFSNSLEEHYAHLRKIFQICEEENIKLKFSKCVFAKTKINFLGYEIKEGCITPDNQNIETIKKLQPPKNVKQLQSFLGSVNVYNKFIDSYAKIREPLNKLLKKDKQWEWTAECQTAFELLKNKLITKPVLQLYDPKLPLHVFCDASLKAIGAILKQPDNSGTLHPVSFHSRTLREYEKNYCITELECLAIIDALDKFYYYLHGKKFIIHTDHAALVWLKNVKNLRGRLFRWSLKLSMFDYEVKYLKGTNNVEADMLSRHPIAQYIQHSVHLLELSEIKTHQNLDNVNDPKYKKVYDVFVLKKKKSV
ncbi:retrovirus-related Pol polyprotein from transposon 17.6 [Trichonephila clavipes]|uniref:Retrovirus-related Pol polyprotein from transposon 17.6 n=1 Tax=Trichonephila clavipes TaxID=2585209 RepID=A0A8X6RNU6_TRICX|nr:retrovirus-related Pol polyprotein from transposon 17.6 [Trichonephila clavipes]